MHGSSSEATGAQSFDSWDREVRDAGEARRGDPAARSGTDHKLSKLSGQIIAFNQTTSNTRLSDPDHPGFCITSGGSDKSQGLECGLSYRPLANWKIVAGYANIDARTVWSLTPAAIGLRPANTPSHQVNSWETPEEISETESVDPNQELRSSGLRRRLCRRVLGRTFLDEHAILERRVFPDEIAYGGWDIAAPAAGASRARLTVRSRRGSERAPRSRSAGEGPTGSSTATSSSTTSQPTSFPPRQPHPKKQ